MPFPVLDTLLVWQGRKKPRDALIKPVLLLGMAVILLLPIENRTTETNIAYLLIENRRGRLKVRRVQQGLRNTPDKTFENSRVTKSFQVPRSRLQDNIARSERRTPKKARKEPGSCGITQNSSAFEMEN